MGGRVRESERGASGRERGRGDCGGRPGRVRREYGQRESGRAGGAAECQGGRSVGELVGVLKCGSVKRSVVVPDCGSTRAAGVAGVGVLWESMGPVDQL